jgi:hypothetical protein
MFGNFLCSKLLFYLAWNIISIELTEYVCTQSILENSEDVPDDSEEQYYKEPDLSGGVEGVDYDIVYGTSEEEPAKAYNDRNHACNGAMPYTTIINQIC